MNSPAAQVHKVCNCFSPVLVHLPEGGQVLSPLNGRNVSYVELSKRHCFKVNNSNAYFYTYYLEMLWHRKCLFAITHSRNTFYLYCATSIESEDTNKWKNYEDEPTKFNHILGFDEHQMEQLLNQF